MLQDLTLNEFLLPNIRSLQQNLGFGTTVEASHNGGSLTVTEFAKDLALGFLHQEMKELSGQNDTTIVERNGGFIFTTTDSSLKVGNAKKVGLKLEITTAGGVNTNNLLQFQVNDKITETIYVKDGMTVNLISTREKVDENHGWKISSIEFNGSKLSAKNLKGTVFYDRSRWLRFVKDARRSLKIAAGTFIRVDTESERKWLCATSDMIFDVSDDIFESDNGKDFGVYLVNEGNDSELKMKAVKIGESAPKNSRKIGRFHTLCADVGTINNAKVPVDMSTTLTNNDYYLCMPYRKEEDPDFYDFYNKKIQSVMSSATHYSTLNVTHPLSDFVAGDILPESIWCLSFKPDTLFEDAMCYNKYVHKANDVYLMSGNGLSTRSAYGATHAVNRIYYNMQEDLRLVGKIPLTDKEFNAAAIGSNEKTAISGAKDWTTVGGHVDTANRRMISFIGLEECCGYLWQILDEVSPSGGSGFSTTDGRGEFGQEYGTPYILVAGADWNNGASCGSRSRDSNRSRALSAVDRGARGSGRVSENCDEA